MTVIHQSTGTAAERSPRFDLLVDLLDEADAQGAVPDHVREVLGLVRSSVDHATLTPELAHRLGMQLRLATGDRPVDDVDLHLLLGAVVSELAEVTALVDGVHLEDITPVIQRLLATGDITQARRLALMAEVARGRVAALESSLRLDLGVA